MAPAVGDTSDHAGGVESTPSEIRVRDQRSGASSICRKILDALPAWFGIPETVDQYVAIADSSPTVITSVNGDDVGIVNVRIHTPYSAEIYFMGILPEHHRRGIGRQMLVHVENSLAVAELSFFRSRH